MLGILNLEEIEGLLLGIPPLVDGLERHDSDAPEKVRSWLSELETALTNNKLSVAGNVATLRGVLASSKGGSIPSEIQFRRRTSGRKQAEATATDVLRRASDVVSDAIRADVSRLAEAERVARQLVAVARYKGVIPDKSSEDDLSGSLRAILRTMSVDSDVGPGTVNLLGLVGPNDALVILDRTITADAPISAV